MTDATEAVVVESCDELVITSMQPGTDIEANFTALQAHVLGIVEEYKGLVVTPEYVGQAKKDRAYLNGLSKSLNQRRIEVKNRYMAPVVAFEERVKQLDAPIKEASAAIDTQVKAFEEQEKADKRAALVEHYEDYAGILLEAVPFERIEDPAWLNRTVNIEKAKEQIEGIVDRIAKDYTTLEEIGVSHPVEAKSEFFATLDLSSAIARSKQLDAQVEAAKRIEEQRAAMEAERVKPEPEPDAQPEPEPTTKPRLWQFSVVCTDRQFECIIAYLKSQGLQGTVKPS